MDRKEVYTVRGSREGGEDERGWENCGLMESVGLERECKRREGEGGGEMIYNANIILVNLTTIEWAQT